MGCGQGRGLLSRRKPISEFAQMKPAALVKHADALTQQLEGPDPNVRRAAVHVLGKIEPVALAQHASDIEQRLEDEDVYVRRAALDVLGKLEPTALSEHADAIARRLEDVNPNVRRAAFGALSNLPPSMLAAHADIVAERLDDEARELRRLAVSTLAKLEPPTLSKYGALIARRLDEVDRDLRRAVVELLGLLEPQTLARQGFTLAQRLEVDSDEEVRRAVINVLGKLELADLACLGSALVRSLQYPSTDLQSATLDLLAKLGNRAAQFFHDIVPLLESQTLSVRQSAVDVIRNLDPVFMKTRIGDIVQWISHPFAGARQATLAVLKNLDVLIFMEHIDVVGSCLEDGDANVRRTAIAVLRKLEPAMLSKYAGGLVKCLEGRHVYEVAADALGKLDPQVLMQHAEAIAHQIQDDISAKHWVVLAVFTQHRFLHAKTRDGEASLHIFARVGDIEACKRLLDAGALIATRNRWRQTAADMARQHEHSEVAILLESHFNTTRAGAGDALFPAMEDIRPIAQIEWYTIALGGFAGKAGGVHSLLAVTVGDPANECTYVIEKADITNGDDGHGRHSSDRWLNGVYVSHWVDVAPNIDDSPLHRLDSSLIQEGPAGPYCMRILREMAVEMGPYNIGTSNCHHMALKLFNACAKEPARVTTLPNDLLARAASMAIDAMTAGNMPMFNSLVSCQSCGSTADNSDSIFASVSTASQGSAVASRSTRAGDSADSSNSEGSLRTSTSSIVAASRGSVNSQTSRGSEQVVEVM